MQWGKWTFNVTTASLEIPLAGTAQVYQIPLESMYNYSRILNWIFHIQEKTWISNGDVGDFVSAIEGIFGRGIVGDDESRDIDAKAILQRRHGCIF